MKLYAVLQEIDLGDHLLAIYSTREIAQKELDEHSERLFQFHGFYSKLYIDDFLLDKKIEVHKC